MTLVEVKFKYDIFVIVWHVGVNVEHVATESALSNCEAVMWKGKG